jgi:hypothetical protein
MVIVFLVWQLETHFGRENDASYLRVLLIPITRLPEIPCKIYSLILVAIRVYTTYRKTQQSTDTEIIETKIDIVDEEVQIEVTPPEKPAETTPIQQEVVAIVPQSPQKKQRKKVSEKKVREKIAMKPRKLDFSSMMEDT